MLNFFLSVSDNRKGFEHKLIFLDELLTLHAYQLVSLTQCLHTVFWGVPGKYNKAVPEVPSGGSLEHSAPAAVCRIRSAAWLSHVGPHHCSSHCQGTQQHLSKCTQNTVLSSTACWGRQEMQVWGDICSCCGCSQDSEVSQCLVMCHYTIIWWSVSQGLSEVPGLGHGPGSELPSVSLLCCWVAEMSHASL